MVYLIVGIILGFIFACLCMTRLFVGYLRYVVDEDGVYTYMQSTKANIGEVLSKKFVLLKVSPDVKSQE